MGRQRRSPRRCRRRLTLRDLRTDDFAFDALVMSPGIPHRPAGAASGRRACARMARADPVGCGTAVPRRTLVRIARTLRRHHRHQRQVHHDRAACAHSGSRREEGRCRRQSRPGGRLALQAVAGQRQYVLEMSSYMLERIATLRFDAAAMLNLSAGSSRSSRRHGGLHRGQARGLRSADGGRSRRGRRRTIARVAQRWRADGVRSRRVGPRAPACRASPADVWCDRSVLRDADGVIVPMEEAHALPGAHNAQNAAAAAAIATALGRVARRCRAWAAKAFLACRIASSASRRSTGSPSSTTARRPMPMPPRARLVATTDWCGSPAGSPRKAASNRWRRCSRASPARS